MDKSESTEPAALRPGEMARKQRHKQERRSFWIGLSLFALISLLERSMPKADATSLLLAQMIAGLSFGLAVAYVGSLCPPDARINSPRGIVILRAAGALAAVVITCLFRPATMKAFLPQFLKLTQITAGSQ